MNRHGTAVIGHEDKLARFKPQQNLGILRVENRCVVPANATDDHGWGDASNRRGPPTRKMIVEQGPRDHADSFRAADACSVAALRRRNSPIQSPCFCIASSRCRRKSSCSSAMYLSIAG